MTTTPIHFADQLAAAVRRCKTPTLVGLDPRLGQLPEAVRPDCSEDDHAAVAAAYATFCKGVIDVVAPLVPAVKPQAAFFEQVGPAGMLALGEVIRYAQEKGLLVIFDGKRNDIGSTATAYAQGLLGRGCSAWSADALTVSPYLGDDSLVPFVDVANERGAGIFILVKTSNPGGGLWQDLATTKVDAPEEETKTLYERVGSYVESLAADTVGDCGYGTVGAVVGATWPEQLAQLRSLMPHTWLLVPGFGSQGGGAADVAGGFDENGLGAIINNSRGIIFAHAKEEYKDRFAPAQWQSAVEAATLDMIDKLRADTTAGNL